MFQIYYLILQVYGFTSEIIEHGIRFSFKEMGLLVDSLYCSVLLYIFCNCSHQVSTNIAEKVPRLLMKIKMDNVDQETIREVKC